MINQEFFGCYCILVLLELSRTSPATKPCIVQPFCLPPCLLPQPVNSAGLSTLPSRFAPLLDFTLLLLQSHEHLLLLKTISTVERLRQKLTIPYFFVQLYSSFLRHKSVLIFCILKTSQTPGRIFLSLKLAKDLFFFSHVKCCVLPFRATVHQ